MIGGYKGSESGGTKGSERVSVHHNLIAHVSRPALPCLSYAARGRSSTTSPTIRIGHSLISRTTVRHETVAAFYISGGRRRRRTSTRTSRCSLPNSGTYSGGARVYVHGNIGPSRTSNSDPDSNWVRLGSRQFIVSTPADAPAVTTTDAQTAYVDVLEGAGNSRFELQWQLAQPA